MKQPCNFEYKLNDPYTFVLSIPIEYEAFKKYDENTFGLLKNHLLTQKLTLLKPNLILMYKIVL